MLQKSILLKLLAKALTPDAGIIEPLGAPACHRPAGDAVL
jgi:hypothetical protein